MAEITDHQRLAEADGANFVPSGMGEWRAIDRHGVIVVQGALSMAEAAMLYCEAQGLQPSTPDDILTGICAAYAPYNAMPEFQHGFDAYRRGDTNPHNADSVEAQAWDRGANAAMQYARQTGGAA